MPLKLIRLPELLKRVPVSRTTIYRLMPEGQFPKPISMGPNSVAWLEDDIDAWIQSKIDQGNGQAA